MSKDSDRKEEAKEARAEAKAEKAKVNYSIVSKGESFRRSGFLFGKVPVILLPDQITDEILNEQMLIVTKVDPEVKKEEKEDE